VNNQVGYSGLVLTRPGVKNLIVEVKRPGALAGSTAAGHPRRPAAMPGPVLQLVG